MELSFHRERNNNTNSDIRKWKLEFNLVINNRTLWVSCQPILVIMNSAVSNKM